MSLPVHVPADRVRSFDFFSGPELSAEPHKRMLAVQRNSPAIFYTPLNGGHWVVIRSAEAAEMLRRPEDFSSDPAHNEANRRWPRTAPNQYDPPEHTNYRRILNPWFSPGIVARRQDEIRTLSAELIDAIVDRGACEFVGEIGERFPVAIFLRMVDADVVDREYLVQLADRFVRHPDERVRLEALRELAGYIATLVAARRVKPGKDLISHILAARVDGRPLDEEELLGMISLVFLGGLDTVTATLSFIIHYLARSPAHYARLRADPASIPRAVEELMRVHGVASTERGAVRDIHFAGVDFRAGDRIIFLPQLYGLDDREVNDPERVDFDRETIRHLIFGAGVHRCIGSHLARVEIHMFLEEWVRRIPTFAYADEQDMETRGGRVWTPVALRLRWPVPQRAAA